MTPENGVPGLFIGHRMRSKIIGIIGAVNESTPATPYPGAA